MDKTIKCDLCSKSARYFVSLVAKGAVETKSCCEDHAIKLGLLEQGAYGYLDNFDLGQSGDSATCPKCGFSQLNLGRNGRLGCPNCYEVFTDIISEIVKRIQKKPQHSGKFPHGLDSSIVYASELKTLKVELDKAITAEDYEKAAALRDQINKITSKDEPGH